MWSNPYDQLGFSECLSQYHEDSRKCCIAIQTKKKCMHGDAQCVT